MNVMHTFLLTGLILLSSCSVETEPSSAELGVAAIGLVVSDIEASEHFYTTIIGMTPAGAFSLDEQWSLDAGAANDRAFSVKQFKMKDQPSATVLKLAYFDDTPKQEVKSGIDVSSGVNYLTLFYENLTPVLERVKAEGIPIVGIVDAETYQIVFIRDPDGIFVELVGPAGNESESGQ